MSNLLPFIFILVCPVMMLFMMRGMHGGGHGTPKAENDKRLGHQMSHQTGQDVTAPNLPSPDGRITQLEHELAQLRDLQARQPAQDQVRRS